MFRIPPGIILAVFLCAPAHASGKGDLKSGYAALLRHDYGLAIRYLTSAIESGDLSPANLALAYHYRGAEYLKTDRYDEAILDLDRAIALNSKLPTAYSDRGIAYRKKGDYGRAIGDYGEAIRIWPRWRDWYLNRGLAYSAAGRHDEAIADFSQALFFKPDYAEAYVARADAYLESGRRAEALADYRRAIREKPGVVHDYPGIVLKMKLSSEPGCLNGEQTCQHE
jgi:tetratricopeptide (TPR) repeat protein